MKAGVIGGGGGAIDALSRLHAALDDLLDLVPGAVCDADLPGLVEGLVLAGHRLHAAQLDAVGSFDAAGLAAATRHRTTTRWLEQRTRASTAQAHGLVRVARSIRDDLPATRDALAEGAVSAQHVAAIAAVVQKVGVEHARQAEPILLELARRSEPSVVRRAAAHLHATVNPEGAQASLDKVYARRGVTLSTVGDRAYLDGVLDLESAETLLAALAPLMSPSPSDDRSSPQRRADALVDLARRALDAGELPVTGGQRPHLSVVVEGRALADGRGAAALPWTGAAVPVITVLRWGCDARLLPVWGAATRGGGWTPLALGRSARTVSPGQVKALQVRDGGCVHPGCSRSAAYCDAHHVRHWADGGRTDLGNLVLLCRHHHRTLHSGQWRLEPGLGPPGDPGGPDAGPARSRAVAHGLVAALPGGSTVPLQTAADRSPPLSPAVAGGAAAPGWAGPSAGDPRG
jgi:hypothetical protein